MTNSLDSHDMSEAAETLRRFCLERVQQHAEVLTREGCPPVEPHLVADLFAHLRTYAMPDLDVNAARAVIKVLDLGWRPAGGAA